MADITGAFEVDGLVKQREELETLMMRNPDMEKRVQKLVRQVLLQARKVISGDIKTAIKSDPRQAYKAVKTAVYRQVLGGSVSILNKRRAGAMRLYVPPRKNRPPHARGGNRMTRSQRTEDVMSYQGADRAFILRFLNAGTQDRTTGSRGGRITANRGRIAPRNFFSTSGHRAMQKAAAQLTNLIDELIKKEMK